jgi:integrase
MREINRALPDVARACEAAAILDTELARVRSGAVATENPIGVPQFHAYAAELFERKVATGEIKSASGREKWKTILERHLIPAFGDLYLDRITKRDVEVWKARIATAPRLGRDKGKALGGRYSPLTVNTILAVLKTVLAAAAADFEDLGVRDPAFHVAPVDVAAHRVYSIEAPNALRLEDVGRFLDEIRMRWPEHYAFVYLGLLTGLRPSSLRPLRRRGAHADLDWSTGVLLVRRSHSQGAETMIGTKNGRDQVLVLPAAVVDVLRWHCARLDREETPDTVRASDLLFPAWPSKWNAGGGFRSRSSMREAFDDVANALELGYKLTPRSMRRTYNDLARTAGLNDLVTRAISGHRTPEMRAHYSTVAPAEVAAGLAKIVDIATARRAA